MANEEDISKSNPEEMDVDEVEQDVEEDAEVQSNKITLLPGASEDGTAASFQILDEDHTLGNSLRYIIIKNPEVEYCGYSIPHPSEAKLNIRIQTYGGMTAVEALRKGLDDLVDICDHVEKKFSDVIAAGDYSTEEP
ncbi:BA75_03109T0 [Komagataella pastoris]|uniref:DNA-directed RNA polymerases I and III subunit RPAC2 n=1 Tax=Komagataella pastoris TaxID=4922 RepID=A0A1B2JC52_PICPA|nr:BA75_03109T0 [Komagataella pastoris]